MTGTERDSDRKAGEPPKAAGAEPPAQAGVLGNLPKKRPAVRSPRRADTAAETAAKPAKESAAPIPETARERAESPPRAADGRGPASEPPEHSTAADIESLARGGIAVAGGAASLGLRIAGRAAAALRDAVERR